MFLCPLPTVGMCRYDFMRKVLSVRLLSLRPIWTWCGGIFLCMGCSVPHVTTPMHCVLRVCVHVMSYVYG